MLLEVAEPPSSRRQPSIISSMHTSWPPLSGDPRHSARLLERVEKVPELRPMFSKILWQILLSVILEITMNKNCLCPDSVKCSISTSCLLLLGNYCESSIGNWLYQHHSLLTFNTNTWVSPSSSLQIYIEIGSIMITLNICTEELR